MVHVCNGILLSHKKRQNHPIYNNMNGTGGYDVKRNKPDRERQTQCDFTHMWKINKHMDKEKRLVVTRGEGASRVGERGNGAHMYSDR